MRPDQDSWHSAQKTTMLPVNKHYACPGTEGWLTVVPVVGVYVSLLMWLAIAVGSAAIVVRAISPLQGDKIALGLLTMVVYGLGLLALPSVVANSFPVIQLQEDGLRVRVFVFRFVWTFIPWEEIERIVARPLWVFGLGRELVWAIQVRRLTCWHRFLGLHWGVGWSPIIALPRGFRDGEELLDIIEAHIGISQDSPSSGEGGG